jgi:hypothetical protein
MIRHGSSKAAIGYANYLADTSYCNKRQMSMHAFDRGMSLTLGTVKPRSLEEGYPTGRGFSAF